MSLTGAGTMQDLNPSPTTTKFTSSALISELTATIDRARSILGARDDETLEQAAERVAASNSELAGLVWKVGE